VDGRSGEKIEPSKPGPVGRRPIKPERVVSTLDKILAKDAIVVADPGTPCPYFSAYYVVKGSGRRFFSNRAHGALGYALAAGLGAHIGRPAVKTVAVMGDGSFGMCVGELETVVRLKLPITFIVISNAVYGWIKAGRNRATASAISRSTSASPITRRSRTHSVSGVGRFRIRGSSRRC
jgi:thiamine pyrophosphate-dependent acetolactate synthase large subunit-like protein